MRDSEETTVAEAIKNVRDAAANNSARRVGMRIGQPAVSAADLALIGAGNQSDVFALPVDTAAWQPLQDVRLGSATLGVLRFLPDVDVPGNPNRWYP